MFKATNEKVAIIFAENLIFPKNFMFQSLNDRIATEKKITSEVQTNRYGHTNYERNIVRS